MRRLACAGRGSPDSANSKNLEFEPVPDNLVLPRQRPILDKSQPIGWFLKSTVLGGSPVCLVDERHVMQRAIQADLRQFREFLSQQVDCDPEDLTPEEVLDQWRASHPLPGELEASAAEIQRTLDEISPESGVLAREASTEIRRSLGLRAKS